LLLLLLLGMKAGEEDELADERDDGDGALREEPGELEPLTLRFEPPKNAGSRKLASLLTLLEGFTTAVFEAPGLVTWGQFH